MRSNYSVYNKNQLQKQVHDESVKIAKEYSNQIYEAHKQNIGNQIAAVFFYVLHKNYKFSKKQLRNVKDKVEQLFYAMDCTIFGQELNTGYYIDYCKNELGIDLDDDKTKVAV